MTPALGTYVSSGTLEPFLPVLMAGTGLAYFNDRWLTWAATVTKSHWALAPVGTGEAPLGVSWRLNNGTPRHLPFLRAPFLLRSAAPLPPLSFSPAFHPYHLPSTKGVIGLEKAELTGILNGDTL